MTASVNSRAFLACSSLPFLLPQRSTSCLWREERVSNMASTIDWSEETDMLPLRSGEGEEGEGARAGRVYLGLTSTLGTSPSSRWEGPAGVVGTTATADRLFFLVPTGLSPSLEEVLLELTSSSCLPWCRMLSLVWWRSDLSSSMVTSSLCRSDTDLPTSLDSHWAW